EVPGAVLGLLERLPVYDVRVRQARRAARLALEGAELLGRPRLVRVEELDRDPLIEAHVAGLVHDAEAALADAAEDLVLAVEERADEGIVRIERSRLGRRVGSREVDHEIRLGSDLEVGRGLVEP